MIKELTDQTLDHAKDADFAYYQLKKDDTTGQWEAGEYDSLGNWETLKEVDKKNYDAKKDTQAANILDHYHDSATGFKTTLILKEDGSKVLSSL